MAEVMQAQIIVAMTRDGVIGKDGRLPWRLSADLRRFKSLTMGHTLIMGRKTWQSLGRPLPGRTSIVISRQQSLALPAEVVVAHSFEEALHHARHDDTPFVIGGAEIYALALPVAARLHITWVEAQIDGDTHFSPWNVADWRLVEEQRHQADAKNQFDFTFATLSRISKEYR